jgi:hypothetical protein
MRDTWDLIAAAPANAIKAVAELAYVSLIYETAWHEEDYGATSHYQGTNFGNPWPVPDPSWDGVNTWALRLQNHVRSVGWAALAAVWAHDVQAGLAWPATYVTSRDSDQDGQDEYLMYNNRVFVVFERWGGRLIHGFAIDDDTGHPYDALQVLGAPMVNPSEPGEEERVGTAANRCSSFKDMNAGYVDAEYAVVTGPDYLEFTSPDGQVTKRITLSHGSATLEADYTNNTGANHYVRVGASPNVYDLTLNGRDNLTTSQTADYYELRNAQGGLVRVYFGTASLNPSPADAGYENRELALTEQIEVYGGASFGFDVQIGTPMFDVDFDADIDGADLGVIEPCLDGPDVTPAGCSTPLRLIDWEWDGDFDLGDYAGMQVSATGAQ